MDIYATTVNDLPRQFRDKVSVVSDVDVLNKKIAEQFADDLAAKSALGEILTIICPVGPIDYSYFAAEIKKRNLDCKYLRTVNMDEYVDEDGKLIGVDHPLSFRKFMNETFFSHLPEDNRPLPENIIFPDPESPEKVTELIDSIGGADICWAGFGITGHVAFNDPPEMLGEPTDLESFKNCKTRVVITSPMANAQMMMGGTNGAFEIIPKRAVTIGMYEMLKSKKFNLTFMRNWHAGLWRKALFGSVTSEFPGSLLQEHPNLEIIMTELAAEMPVVNTSQATGEVKS
jgi:glucosamine-6-phosphate deaminase